MAIKTKTIYFIADACPTEKEREDAARFSGKVVFRNVRFIGDESPEPCDFVAGKIPKTYEHIPQQSAQPVIEKPQPFAKALK